MSNKQVLKSVISEPAPKVLLVGYNGKNNTGSEARLLSIMEDMRSAFGPEVRMTIPTLDTTNLRRYVEESPTVSIVQISSIFYPTVRRLVKEADLVVLTEGSTYMDTWGSPLLWAFLWATRCAYAFHKPCLAYAVDAGNLSPSNTERVRRQASKTGLIITRTKAASDRLTSWGVTAPIKVTEDAALTFRVDKADQDIMRREWPEASHGVVGIAAVDFYQWPVVIRPFGPKSRCYQWPYYFSSSSERMRSRDALAAALAEEADHIVDKHGKSIAMISMESVDEPLARDVMARMRNKSAARMFSSARYNASQMASLLRSLDLLITSRYHAAVLSLAGAVPQVAIGHDVRLDELYRDLGIHDHYYSSNATVLWSSVMDDVDRLLNDPMPAREMVRKGHMSSLKEAEQNLVLLKDFAQSKGLRVVRH